MKIIFFNSMHIKYTEKHWFWGTNDQRANLEFYDFYTHWNKPGVWSHPGAVFQEVRNKVRGYFETRQFTGMEPIFLKSMTMNCMEKVSSHWS